MRLADINTCTGCGACAQKCHTGSILMKPASIDGFLYPVIKEDTCIDCGACSNVCPVFLRSEETSAIHAYAYQNCDNSILMSSSSGGLFSTLAEKILETDGVVFGAKFTDDWQVEIDSTESIDGISSFRGSKYVQANVGNSFVKAKLSLDSGRKVLFTGTPCQIAGLKAFLKKDYNNLLTMDVICHGVPSPKAWNKYINEHGENIKNVSFRDKSTGWKSYSVTIGRKSKLFCDNIYMKAFLSNLDLRLCCDACLFKSGKSGSDITFGDFWGINEIHPESDNDRGLCCVVINTQRGKEACTDILSSEVYPLEMIEQYNPSYRYPSKHNINRAFFFNQLDSKSFSTSFKDATSSCLIKWIKRKRFRSTHK